MLVMAKKKKVSGKHQAPRAPVQFPADWLAVARALAASRQQPLVWFLVAMVKEKAEAEGMPNLPDPPWQPSDK